jgi:argininosuccinate lyase
VYGHLLAQLTTMKGLPLSYNRDLQEDKAALFDAVDTLSACLGVVTPMLAGIRFDTERMEQAAGSGYLNATDLADYLVRQGMPFREAHHCVGQAVRHAIAKGLELHELPFRELQSFSALIKEDARECLNLREVVNRRQCPGGTAKSAVLAAIENAEKRMA